jgi:alkanesulfonate monooxygenase SsuD/methylene tetrahydromethanopterin reductase-like flavin-dependent oxidoreductase (luciferase family)
MEFGFCIPCFASPGAALFRTPRLPSLDPVMSVEAGVLAEDLGYDSLWMADHLILGVDGAILEGWTTLSVLAGRTRRIRLGMIHMGDALRHPGHAAKMVATLDALTGGRTIFFYDAGWGVEEQVAYGFPNPPETERLARLDEGLELISKLWSGQIVNHVGQYYRTVDAVCRPTPMHPPPVWLGEVRDDVYLDIVARHADGWNSVPVSPDGYRKKWSRVADAFRRAGRDPDRVTRSLEIQILIAPTRARVREILEECAALPPAPRFAASPEVVAHLRDAPKDGPPLPDDVASRWIIGTPDEVDAQLRAFASEGVSHMMFWFADFPSHDGMRLFAEEVMPRWHQ